MKTVRDITAILTLVVLCLFLADWLVGRVKAARAPRYPVPIPQPIDPQA